NSLADWSRSPHLGQLKRMVMAAPFLGEGRSGANSLHENATLEANSYEKNFVTGLFANTPQIFPRPATKERFFRHGLAWPAAFPMNELLRWRRGGVRAAVNLLFLLSNCERRPHLH